MSPESKSFVSVCPAGLITVVRTRPLNTNAHSAAVACQCNSRITPGSSCIDTPAIPFEIGNCSTVTSLPKLFPRTLPLDFSSSNLNVGNSFPDRSESGTLFWKLTSRITGLLARSLRNDQANHASAGRLRTAIGNVPVLSAESKVPERGSPASVELRRGRHFETRAWGASNLNSTRRQSGTPQTPPAPASRLSVRQL